MSSFTLGLGSASLWLGSWLLRRREPGERLAAWATNGVLLALFVLVLVRGQMLQGIRYFLPFYGFVIVANIEGTMPSVVRLWRRTLIAGAALVVLGWAGEGWLVRHISRDRSGAFLRMRSSALGRLAGEPGVAYDIGFVGYFTGAQICDLNGLVNGREAAARSPEERLRACEQSHPRFALLTPKQAADVGPLVAGWPVCGEYRFTNVARVEPHQLRIAPALAGSICPEPAR